MQLTIIGQAIVQRIKRHIIIEGQKRILVAVILVTLALAGAQGTVLGFQLAQVAPDATQSAPLTPEALQQLVAPIALYPDALVAQILAASTYPSQIVEADRWLQDHSGVQDDKLAKEVDKQSWDPSIKALTPFPSVLSNLDTNLSWTSSLGDAYFNQQQDVLDEVQVLRSRAKDAGNLQSNQQQTVTSQGPTIVIQPANPEVAYLPAYDPWLVYGAPIGIYPGYIYDSVGGPYVSFGLGIGIGGGFWDGFGWGWNSWGFDWRDHNVIFNHNNYVSNSRTFFHRVPGSNGGFRGGQGRSSFQGNGGTGVGNRNRGGDFPNGNLIGNRNQGPSNSNFGHENSGTIGTSPSMQNRNPSHGLGQSGPNTSIRPGDLSGFGQERSGILPTPSNMQNGQDYRGFGQPGPNTGTRSGAFSGFGQGGIERGSAARGQASLGGGGGFGGRTRFWRRRRPRRRGVALAAGVVDGIDDAIAQ